MLRYVCAQERPAQLQGSKVSSDLTVSCSAEMLGSSKFVPNCKERAAASSRFDVKLPKGGLNFSSWTWLQGSLFSHIASSTCSSLSLGIIAEAALSAFPM